MTTRPTVLLIDNSISFTGALKCALQQARLLSPEYRYIFLLPKGSAAIPAVQEQGFAVHTLPMLEIRRHPATLLRYGPRLLRNLARLKKLVKRERVDIVVMNDFYNLLGAGLKLSGTPVKLITHVRFLPAVMPAPLRRLWTSAALRYADAVVAVSEAVKEQLPAHSKVRRVYDALEMEEQHPAASPAAPGETELLCLGNFIPGKGQDHALAAFTEAYKKNPSLRLRFAGGDMGLQKNRDFRAALESEAKAAGLEAVVWFEPFQKNTERLYREAAIALNFSEAESFSMTCAEAAYYGTPQIATRCGGPEEIIRHGVTGLLVPNRDRAAMTEAILQLAADRRLQQRFSEAGRQFVRERFSAAAFREAFLPLLRS